MVDTNRSDAKKELILRVWLVAQTTIAGKPIKVV
jgi:hypothetical protein